MNRVWESPLLSDFHRFSVDTIARKPVLISGTNVYITVASNLQQIPVKPSETHWLKEPPHVGLLVGTLADGTQYTCVVSPQALSHLSQKQTGTSSVPEITNQLFISHSSQSLISTPSLSTSISKLHISIKIILGLLFTASMMYVVSNGASLSLSAQAMLLGLPTFSFVSLLVIEIAKHSETTPVLWASS